MELIVLGCWAPYPRAGGACSGYLIREGGLNILLEAGNGSLSRLMSLVDFRCLHTVIVTHLHHDHYLDLFPLRHAVEGAMREGSINSPIKLYTPGTPAEEYNLLASYNKAFEAKTIESLPLVQAAGDIMAHRLDLDGLTLRFAPTRHSVTGFSVSLTGSRKLVFSGDTARTGELVALAEEADLFLCEASGLDSDTEAMKDVHLTARQAGEIAGDSRVKRLLLTHFWPEYDPAVLCSQAAEEYSGTISVAREWEAYKI